jgi:hypothetical protein
MPKELSHILIAQDVFEELKASGRKRLARIIEKNLPAFYLGAIIPDAFFYDATPFLRLSKSNPQIVWALHLKEAVENDARAVGFFDVLTGQPHEWHAKLAFAAGIVTHTVSDRIIHGVIEHCTRLLDQKAGLVMAAHRELETLMDMVLLRSLGLHPRQFHFERLVDMDHRTRNMLFQFYLCHVTEDHQAAAPRLRRSLSIAFTQQRLCLKLFTVKALYQIMNISNKVAGGRLETWASLFYPDTVGIKGFPVMDRLNPTPLIHDQSFGEPLRSVVKGITRDAISHIAMGLRRLG